MFKQDNTEDNKYFVEWIQQNEVNDIFKITRKRDGFVAYDTYPRSMEYTVQELIEDDLTIYDYIHYAKGDYRMDTGNKILKSQYGICRMRKAYLLVMVAESFLMRQHNEN